MQIDADGDSSGEVQKLAASAIAKPFQSTAADVDSSDARPDHTAIAAISDPTWRPSSAHVQPTWAPQPERKCGGHGGGDHACALAVDVAALLQLTAWVEKLDAINHMNGGEDQLIINIRSQAVGVLDAWTKRWYATHAMTDDARR